MNIIYSLSAVVSLFFAVNAHAADKPSWADSYEVDGVCYCIIDGAGAFDHGIGNMEIDGRSIRDTCEAIGVGPEENRVYYNDIQCGNGPANNSADEEVCPGIPSVGNDSGPDCNVKGPTWSLDIMQEEEEVPLDGDGGTGSVEPGMDEQEPAVPAATTDVAPTAEEPCDCDDLALDENDPFGNNDNGGDMAADTPLGEEPCDCDDLALDENNPFGVGEAVQADTFTCSQMVFNSMVQFVCK